MHTILLVEDDAAQREPLSMLLERRGFALTTAGDGQEALQELHDGFVPCIIILDLQMPGMDGFAFRAEQLRDPSIARIPVILYSSGADINVVARQLGVTGYVAKPGNVTKLIQLVADNC